VQCDGQDANAAMVKAGMAWAYTKYLTAPEIKRLKVQARADKVGLWADGAPVPPWKFRHPTKQNETNQQGQTCSPASC